MRYRQGKVPFWRPPIGKCGLDVIPDLVLSWYPPLRKRPYGSVCGRKAVAPAPLAPSQATCGSTGWSANSWSSTARGWPPSRPPGDRPNSPTAATTWAIGRWRHCDVFVVIFFVRDQQIKKTEKSGCMVSVTLIFNKHNGNTHPCS